jgi:hypothetical protein
MASKIEVTYDLGDPVPEGEDMNIDDGKFPSFSLKFRIELN